MEAVVAVVFASVVGRPVVEDDEDTKPPVNVDDVDDTEVKLTGRANKVTGRASIGKPRPPAIPIGRGNNPLLIVVGGRGNTEPIVRGIANPPAVGNAVTEVLLLGGGGAVIVVVFVVSVTDDGSVTASLPDETRTVLPLFVVSAMEFVRRRFAGCCCCCGFVV